MINKYFTITEFFKLFPDNETCLNEIVNLKNPRGYRCPKCKNVTVFYKIIGRPAYSCKFCRYQLHPLTGTIFEKTTTPLLIWFYALFIMTKTKAGVSARTLQRELGVTYKTAWRMRKSILYLMNQNGRDLLKTADTAKKSSKEYRWTLFNTVVISVVSKEEPSTGSGDG